MYVLLIEDYLPLVQTLTRSLGALSIRVESCGDGLAADDLLRHHDFDAVVLDLALPRLSGIEILRRIRERSDAVPVLVLTASGDTVDRVRGLNFGADDYMAKPFDLSELEARLRAIRRRSLGALHPVLQVGQLHYDPVSRRFSVASRDLSLPPREHDVLETLIEHAGRPVSKHRIAEQLRSKDCVLSHEALDIYVHRLRRKLESSGAAIHTLRGMGYLLEPTDDSPA